MKSFKQYIFEGGNVFAGKTASIKKEDIKPTLDAYFKELKKLFPRKARIFSTRYFIPLGSVGKKKVSGDIDLGVDVSVLLDKKLSDKSISEWNIDPAEVQIEFEKLLKRARSSKPEQLKVKAFLKELVKYINRKAPNIHTDEKKVTTGNIFGFYPQIDSKGKKIGIGVQLDWMIGNLNWLKFSYYSSAYPEGSNVKGLHRTQLLLSAFQLADLTFDHVSGVKDKKTREIIATDPKKALQVLNSRLGLRITSALVDDYYKLHKHLKSKLSRNDYNTIQDIYFKILDRTRADIPDDMQEDWLRKKSKLGLTGKFLPNSSKLRNV